jgi:predicted acetyltransferase
MRYLTQGEKENSRRLYECCFPEDSQKFVDYYYQEKCRDNEIAVIEENGKIISMVHANPFTVSCCGTQAEVHYIVAVATDPEYRRRGYMRQLMQQVLRDCRNRGEVFSFLMPADPAYYEPLGYRYWNNQYVWEIPKEQELLLKGFCHINLMLIRKHWHRWQTEYLQISLTFTFCGMHRIMNG